MFNGNSICKGCEIIGLTAASRQTDSNLSYQKLEVIAQRH
jgi:hypothetical protein